MTDAETVALPAIDPFPEDEDSQWEGLYRLYGCSPDYD